MLRQPLATSPTTHGIKTVTEKNKPLRWEDFGPEAIPQLEEYTAKAAHDVWWTWPEAIAWVGSEDYCNIATLRQWGNLLKHEAGHALKGQEDIARNFCTSPQQAEASLMQAIETGAVQTSGRSKPNASSMRLEPQTWRGGAITFSHGIQPPDEVGCKPHSDERRHSLLMPLPRRPKAKSECFACVAASTRRATHHRRQAAASICCKPRPSIQPDSDGTFSPAAPCLLISACQTD